MSINPLQHLFGSYVKNHFRHGHAERAVITPAAAFNIKQYLESGEVKPDRLNEQPLCTTSFQWILSSSREPHSHVDRIKNFAGMITLLPWAGSLL